MSEKTFNYNLLLFFRTEVNVSMTSVIKKTTSLSEMIKPKTPSRSLSQPPSRPSQPSSSGNKIY